MDNLADIKSKFPDLTLEEQERLTRLRCADPRNGKYGPHQTGGALDLTLCQSDGLELDMGGAALEFSDTTRTYPLKNDKLLIGKNVLKNREILYSSLNVSGFKNYPMEWWHYCYGDKMWAAYSDLNKCVYGCVDEKIKFLR